MPNPWDPAQYARFAAERAQPFRDLLALVQPRPGMRVVDLGCGPGDLTAALHRDLSARETVGLDSSPAMLARASKLGTLYDEGRKVSPIGTGLRFVQGAIEDFAPESPFDLVFSNAALHWVPDHPALLERLRALLPPGGQLAVQMPANDAHASHRTAAQLARSPEFSALLGGFSPRAPLLPPARYAELLHGLGFAEQHVRLQVYAHLLPDRESVVEWVRGALLTDYQQRLSAPDFERFLARYRDRLLPQLGETKPFLYTYERLLLWGRLPG